jgi:hypothetical protein
MSVPRRAQRGRSTVELSAAVIRHGDRRDALIDRPSRIVAGEDALGDDRPTPALADPAKVRPRHRGARQRGVDVEEWHRPLAGDHDVRERPETAIAQEAEEPARMREDVRQERQLLQHAAADQRLHAVAVIALAQARDGRVDRDDERAIPGDAGTLDDRLGRAPTAQQIELEEHGPGGAGLHVLQPVTGDGREDVGGAGRAGRARGRDLATRVHHPAVADRGQ